MKLKLKLNLLLIIFTFVFTGNVFAVCVPGNDFDPSCLNDASASTPDTSQTATTTPADGTPTSASDNSCGYVKPGDGQSSQCCTTRGTDPYFFSKIIGADTTLCLPLVLGGWCPLSFITKIEKSVRDTKLYEYVGIDAIISLMRPMPCRSGGVPQDNGSSCICVDSVSSMCKMYLGNDSGMSDCESCMNRNGFFTAIGCVDFTNFGSFITKGLLTPLLSFGGLVTFLLIIYAAVLIMTSSGDPEKIKKAKEMLTSALTGLIFIILSIFILKFIGGDLLGIFNK